MATTLDRPDTTVRGLFEKRNSGQALNGRENRRLAERASAEEETTRQGGAVKATLPRQQDPREAYQRGYEGTRQLFQQPDASAAPDAATPRTGMTRAQRMGRGGIDVNSYTGSRYSAEGAQPGGASPQPSAEAGADSMLRGRFGPPPNERGQIDIADKNGQRSVAAPQGGGGHTFNINIGAPGAGGTGATPLSGDTAGAQPGEVSDDEDNTTAPPPTQQIGAPPVPAGNAAITAPPNPQPLQQSAPTPGAAPAGAPAAQRPGQGPAAPGGANPAPKPRTAPVPAAPQTPARKLGFSQRGSGAPKGQDANGAPGAHTAGSGLYARSFGSADSAARYNGFVRKLFKGAA